MSDVELPHPGRRALVIWYDDAANTVEMDAEAFTWLEVPVLLHVAMGIAEENLPCSDYADDTEE